MDGQTQSDGESEPKTDGLYSTTGLSSRFSYSTRVWYGTWQQVQVQHATAVRPPPPLHYIINGRRGSPAPSSPRPEEGLSRLHVLRELRLDL